MAFRKGTAGNDVLHGTAGKDTFNLSQGGNDRAYGGGGNDTFIMGAKLNAADRINGGSGNDTVKLAGNYGAGLTFAAKTIVGIETLQLLGNFNYNLKLSDANVAKGKTLKVDAGALNASHALTFDGTAEKNGHFDITGGHGNDVIKGGTGNDTFRLNEGGTDRATGGNGNDTFAMGGTLNAADRINGGSGTDTLALGGNYKNLVLGAATVVGIEKFTFAAGHDYKLTTNNATVARNKTLTVDAHTLHGKDNLVFNGSAETNGSFAITGGAGKDTITGGTHNDSVYGGGGKDTINLARGGNDTAQGGSGNDTFVMGAKLMRRTGSTAAAATTRSRSTAPTTGSCSARQPWWASRRSGSAPVTTIT